MMTNEEKVRQKEITEQGNPAKPQGKAGKLMLERMNKSHAELTRWGLGFFTWQGEENVLDIGCGGGAALHQMSQRLSSRGHLTGIDYSETSVAASKKYNQGDLLSHKMEILQASVQELPFVDNTFDKIITVESFYFWPNPSENLREVFRVMKPNATFLLLSEIYQHEGLRPETLHNIEEYHLFNPSRREFCQLFEQAGFLSIETHVEEQHAWICVEGHKL
jgi:SAM-dependent methyltransferase